MRGLPHFCKKFFQKTGINGRDGRKIVKKMIFKLLKNSKPYSTTDRVNRIADQERIFNLKNLLRKQGHSSFNNQ